MANMPNVPPTQNNEAKNPIAPLPSGPVIARKAKPIRKRRKKIIKYLQGLRGVNDYPSKSKSAMEQPKYKRKRFDRNGEGMGETQRIQ